MEAQFSIGTKFIRRNTKRADVEMIVDILTTKNSDGLTVKVEYVATHQFGLQTIKDNVLASTIARSEILKGASK